MVYIKLWEGLGNQLFQYAYARMLKEKGFDVCLFSTEIMEDFFADTNCIKREIGIDKYNISLEIQRNINFKELFDLNSIKIVEQKEASEYRLEYLCDIDESYIKGWFQNEKYFFGIKDILLNEITVGKERMSALRSILPEKESKQIVAVHIRRGDYKKYGKILPLTYYMNAIRYMRSFIENPFFLFFSDEIQWVERITPYLGCDDNVAFCIGNQLSYYEEPILMSLCNHMIIANSTFSWWGAWLNNNQDKRVIAPSGQYWFGGQENIVPDNWISM